MSVNGAKLATRTGNVILLKDLFAEAIEKVTQVMTEKNPALQGRTDIAEQVGVGAIVFYYLSNNRMRDINFSMDDALNFDGNTGPYAQYTYARACSLLEKAGDIPAFTPGVAVTPEEGEVAKVLARFPEAVKSALADYEPSDVTRYILDLCAAFNRFYHNCQILSAPDDGTRSNRIALTAAVRTVLGRALHLICLSTPEKI